MDKETKRLVKNLVLTLRESFEDDIAVVLGRYGIFADKKWERADKLTYLSEDEKQLKDKIEKIIQKEMGSGITQGEATRAYIRDTSFTHINRLIGLRCMEERGLIDETIKTRDVYSGRSMRHRNFLHEHPEYASDPEDGLVPCLKEVCAEITDEIKILFDPNSEISLVWPRYRTLKDAIALIDDLDESVWTADDMLGWVYQYFNSKEKDRIFEEVKKKKKKIAGEDIIPATQVYTPKFMVQFLVENSVGSFWQQMYPDSKLHETLEYFVLDPNETTRNPKPVKDITFLDPACGSGHLMNLVVADAVMMDSNKLDEFLAEVGGDKKLEELVKIIWSGMQNVRELGSLLKVKEQIDALIEQELSDDDKPLMIAEVADSIRQNWEKRKSQLMKGFRNYYEKATQVFDVNRQLFANEAIKGVQLLDLLERRYDVVATNPPYMHRRKIGATLKKSIETLYPQNNADLYAAFVERCLRLTQHNGYTAMITQQSFMFITTYEPLRELVLTSCHIRTMAHLGPRAFEDIAGETVNTTMFAFAKRDGDDKTATFLRLVSEEDKANALKKDEQLKYQISQKDLKIIDGWPIVYWIGTTISRIFTQTDTLIKYGSAKEGINTGNNEEFIRYHWEVPMERTHLDWRLAVKGGDFNKWYGNLDNVCNFDIEKMQRYSGSAIRNREFLGQEGLTFSGQSSKGFTVRYMPHENIFIGNGRAIFLAREVDIFFALGYLNSLLVKYFLGLFSSTINFTVGDINRLPFRLPNQKTCSTIADYAKHCLELKKNDLRFILMDCEFRHTVLDWAKFQNPDAHTLAALFRVYLDHKETELVKLHTYEGLIDREIFDLYEIDGDDLQQILEEQGTPAGWYPLVEGFELIPDDLLPEAKRALENHERKTFSGDELNELTLRLQELYEEKGKSIEEIAIALEIHPASVVSLRQELDLVNPAELKDEVENFLTHRILESLKADSDGIIPLDETGVEANMLTRLRSALELTFGTDDAFAIEDEMRDILGKPLEKWLATDFFKKHISQYKKRPIVWHVQSPDKNFACYVYYHKLDNDTLPKVRTNYLWRALEAAKGQLSASEEQLLLFEQAGDKASRKQHKEIEKLEKVVVDLQELDARLESITSAGYNPDIDDGVKVNITPLQEAGVLAVKKVV